MIMDGRLCTNCPKDAEEPKKNQAKNNQLPLLADGVCQPHIEPKSKETKLERGGVCTILYFSVMRSFTGFSGGKNVVWTGTGEN